MDMLEKTVRISAEIVITVERGTILDDDIVYGAIEDELKNWLIAKDFKWEEI